MSLQLKTSVAVATLHASLLPGPKRRTTDRALLGWLALAVGCLAPGLHAAPTLYPQADPTAQEQSLLQQLNRARQDPAREGQRLAAWLRNTAYGQAVIATFGTNPDQVTSDFAALPAVPPMAFDPDLLAAARAHSADLATHNGLGPGATTLADNIKLGPDGSTPIAHLGWDGSNPISRVQASGFQGDVTGENVASGFASLDTIHAAFLIDWGNPKLGHRQIAMGTFLGQNVVGIGVASFSGVVPLVETEDYGAPYPVPGSNGNLVTPDLPAMLTGVVYRDANANGQYDPDEGLAGATVTMDSGSFYAVTTASGGYSFPLVRADGSNVDGPVTVRVTFADGSSASTTVTVQKFSNAFGPYRGNVEWEVTAGTAGMPAFFDGSAALAQGWNYLAFSNGNPFGYYNTSPYPYLYHNDLGWEYVLDARDNNQGVYLYDFTSGDWWYTSPSFAFPYLYDFARQSVLYYYPADGRPGFYSSQPRYFYDFAAKKIITL